MLQRFSSRLSTKRRSRLALPALLLAGLLATGGLYAAFSPAQADETRTADATQLQLGRKIFEANCSSCHGLNAEGIRTKKGSNYGPPLIGVGAAAVDFQVGTGRMPMAQPGTQALRKAPVLNDEETAAVAAYIASLGTGPAIPTEDMYDPTKGDVVRGGEIFRTNCTACHNFAGSGGALPHGRFAPKLTGVEPKHIYEILLAGSQQMPSFTDGNLSPEDKRDVIAYLKSTEENPGYGGFSMGALGPVAEGLFVWLVGIAALIGIGVWITSNGARVKRNTKGDA